MTTLSGSVQSLKIGLSARFEVSTGQRVVATGGVDAHFDYSVSLAFITQGSALLNRDVPRRSRPSSSAAPLGQQLFQLGCSSYHREALVVWRCTSWA